MEKKEVWICSNCGKKYGNKPVGIATWHEDVCDICGKKTVVTEPRDFGGLKQSREIPVDKLEDTEDLRQELFTFFLWFRWNGEKYMNKSIEKMIKVYLEERELGDVLGKIEKQNKLKRG